MDDSNNPLAPLCLGDKCASLKEINNGDCIRNAGSQIGVASDEVRQGEDSAQDGLVSSGIGVVLNKTKKRRRPKHKKKSKKKANASKDESSSDTEVEEDDMTGLGISYPFDTQNNPASLPYSFPTSLAVIENRVDRAVRQWKALNDAPISDSNELFDLCLSSESIVYNALVNFRPLEINSFKRKLNECGYEVKDAATHHAQALEFGLRIPQKFRDFPITEAEKELGTRQLSFTPSPDGSWVQYDSSRRLFSPRLELWVRAIHREVIEVYQRERIIELEKERLERIEELDKEFHERSEGEGDQGQSQGYQSSYRPELVSELAFEGEETNLFPPNPAALKSGSGRSTRRPGFEGEFYPSSPEYSGDESGLEIKTRKSARISETQDSTDNNNSESTPKLKSFTMSNVNQINIPLPVLPQDWPAGVTVKITGTLSPAIERSIEPVGPHFLAHARRARHKRTFSEDDRIQAQENVKKIEEDDDGEISEPEDPLMLSRDAKDWKNQDHYAVLGLSKYRYKATEEQIKRAHRKKVLRHHPDKKAAAGSTEDDSFFKCIQKATEILLDPVKRRQYDSVDEHADVEPPTKRQVQKGNFYKLWGPVFKAEGRFSRVQPVPKLGDENSTKEEVENFYNFWYNFDSWRSFEYQDEDVPDDNENRDQKRHMERKNNNARKKKKTEDSARLRKLLDECSSMDERIKKFRQEANASKNKKRVEKEAAEKRAAEEAKARKEAEEKAAKEAEEAAKAEREQGKKAKEAAKNAIKKNKRVLKGSVKDANYFVHGDPSAAQIDAVLNDIDLIQGKVDADEIAALAGKLGSLKVAIEIKGAWSAEVKRLVEAGKLKDGEVKTLA